MHLITSEIILTKNIVHPITSEKFKKSYPCIQLQVRTFKKNYYNNLLLRWTDGVLLTTSCLREWVRCVGKGMRPIKFLHQREHCSDVPMNRQASESDNDLDKSCKCHWSSTLCCWEAAVQPKINCGKGTSR